MDRHHGLRIRTSIEKLDALSWLNVNALDRFTDEFRIQLAWLRQSTLDTQSPAFSFDTRIREMKSMLAEGIRSGEISIQSPSGDVLARCVIGDGWIPENILVRHRTAQFRSCSTATITLRGIAVRRR